MTTLRERFEEKLMEVSVKQNVWWVDTDNSKWNVTNNINFTDELLTFIKQELMLLPEEVEKAKVSNYYDEKAQINFNAGLNAAAAIIRTRADEI